MEEIWKDIVTFEGKYQVSNTGKVRSIDRVDKTGRKREGIELKQYKDSTGYYRVALWYTKHSKKDIRVHSLVINAFIPDNPENKRVVNHKDGNKLNNNLTNLERATDSENHLHAYRMGLKVPSHTGKFGKLHHNSKPINQYSLDGVLLNEYEGLMDADRKTGLNFRNISLCAKGKRNSCGGYLWKYV